MKRKACLPDIMIMITNSGVKASTVRREGKNTSKALFAISPSLIPCLVR